MAIASNTVGKLGGASFQRELLDAAPDFEEHYESATLVLVDLHGESSLTEVDENDFTRALEKCRIALNFARIAGMSVAFVRYKPLAASLLATQSHLSWLRDFRPYRSDMVFERALPSCYASIEFADMARRSGNLILAGIFGETSCLATLIEGHSRNHRFTFLSDACVSRARADISAETMHRSVVGIASLYCEVTSTDGWIDSISQKFAGIG